MLSIFTICLEPLQENGEIGRAAEALAAAAVAKSIDLLDDREASQGRGEIAKHLYESSIPVRTQRPKPLLQNAVAGVRIRLKELFGQGDASGASVHIDEKTRDRYVERLALVQGAEA
jgi:hypothetical protein